MKSNAELETAEKLSSANLQNSTFASDEGYFRALPENNYLVRVAVPWLMIAATLVAMGLAIAAVIMYGDATVV